MRRTGKADAIQDDIDNPESNAWAQKLDPKKYAVCKKHVNRK